MLSLTPVIPVVVIDAVDQAVPAARALAAGGVRIVEITLRTSAALEAIAAVARDVPDVRVGAGTVTTPSQAEEAADAGASFLVSPGVTPRLLAAMAETGLPFLPGTATVSEALAAIEAGSTELKFFPANAAGGPAYLSSILSVVPARFCPTGGVTPATAPDYFACGNVGCVGGSWLTPREALASGDWDRITKLAAQTHSLRRPGGVAKAVSPG